MDSERTGAAGLRWVAMLEEMAKDLQESQGITLAEAKKRVHRALGSNVKMK